MKIELQNAVLFILSVKQQIVSTVEDLRIVLVHRPGRQDLFFDSFRCI